MNSSIILKDGTTITVPRIVTVDAGWVLRPDEARTQQEIKSGTNKSFGRGYDGRNEGKAWLRNHIQSLLEKANWAPVASHDFLLPGDPNDHRDGLKIAIKDPAHGWNTFKISVYTHRYARETRVELSWTASGLMQWFVDREVKEPNPGREVTIRNRSWAFKDERDPGIYELVKTMADNPHKFIQEEFKTTLPWEFPPFKIPNQPDTKYVGDEQEFFWSLERDVAFYRNGNLAQEVFLASSHDFELLQTAFAHLGIEFRVGIRKNYDVNSDNYGKERIESLFIEVPATPGDFHNGEGHTIQLNVTGANIICGYALDDKRWQERQARLATDWLVAFETETTPERTYEDYEYTPREVL